MGFNSGFKGLKSEVRDNTRISDIIKQEECKLGAYLLCPSPAPGIFELPAVW